MSCDEEFSPPPAKQPKLQPARGISDLGDVDFAAIFRHLPPYDRLLVSEVCQRWHAISRKAWLDIVHLDLSEIPGPNIAAIIKQCPNLRHVTAERKIFDANDLHILSRISLSSLKLHACAFVTRITEDSRLVDPLAALFSSLFRAAPWDELVLHNLTLEKPPDTDVVVYWFPSFFPKSLKRLQITDNRKRPFYDLLTRGCWLPKRLQLECLILRCTQDTLSWDTHQEDPICEALMGSRRLGAVVSLPKLRELMLSFRHQKHLSQVLRLRKLEILFLHNTSIYFTASDKCFVRLVTKHPKLRILVLTGSFDTEMEFPKRVRYANGFNAPPLPQLHIFVGRRASEKISFPIFPSDAAKVYPITEPLPQFLDRDDVAPIFKDCWIAEKIREAAKNGSKLFKYERDVASSLRASDN